MPRARCRCHRSPASRSDIKEPLDLSTDELWAERGEVVACPNDKAAIKVAEQWAQEHEVEVWEKAAHRAATTTEGEPGLAVVDI